MKERFKNVAHNATVDITSKVIKVGDLRSLTGNSDEVERANQ